MFFTVSEIPSGPTELSQVQRDKRKLGTMCHALIVEHMFTPNLDTYTGDDAIMETFTREDSARASRANVSRADKMTFDRKKAEWKRHLATVRSTLSGLSEKLALRQFSKILSRCFALISCRTKWIDRFEAPMAELEVASLHRRRTDLSVEADLRRQYLW